MSVPQPESEYKGPTDLVIVCCHATYIGDGSGNPSPRPVDERQWISAPFQQSSASSIGVGEQETFIQHAIQGLHAARRRDTSVVFSGGMTASDRVSEAHSYRDASSDYIETGLLSQYTNNREASDSIVCEEWATDSYQNSLFSILKFRQHHRRYPRNVTVITHAFKAPRFSDSHAPAIRWPADRIRVQGMNPPFTAAESAETEAGERERGYALFVNDPYGVMSPLADKRRQRRWDEEPALKSIGVGEGVSEDEVERSLRWKGGENGREIFPVTEGELTWPFSSEIKSPRKNET